MPSVLAAVTRSGRYLALALALALTSGGFAGRASADAVTIDAFAINEFKQHSDAMANALNNAQIAAQTTATYRSAVRRAQATIDYVKEQTDALNIFLDEGLRDQGLPVLCNIDDGKYLGYHQRSVVRRSCRSSSRINLNRGRWHKLGTSYLDRRWTIAEEFIHSQQTTPIKDILKNHCWNSLAEDPIPPDAEPEDKNHLAGTLMMAAAAVELNFQEAQAELEFLCNIWAVCGMARPAKTDPLGGRASAIKKKRIEESCKQMEEYCCALETAVAQAETAYNTFANEHTDCRDQEGNYVATVSLVGRSGSLKTVGEVNLTQLYTILQDYAARKGQKANEDNGTEATGMAKAHKDKKDDILCRLQ